MFIVHTKRLHFSKRKNNKGGSLIFLKKSIQQNVLFTAITSPMNVYCTSKKTAFFLERKNNKGA